MSFSIDDVRDTFEKDVASFIARIEERSQELSSSSLLAEENGVADDRGFGALEDWFHTLFGTSMLVGATSIASTAEKLERRTAEAIVAMRELEERRKKAREVAILCGEAARELRTILALELDKKRADAEQLAAAFHARRLDAPPPSRVEPAGSIRPKPAPSDGTEFAFGEPDAGAPVDPQLLEVFRQEALEASGRLLPLLERLALQPDDYSCAADIERVFHTLKGSAATVGLSAVSDLAVRLRHRMELVMEGDVPADTAFLGTVIEDTNELLRLAGLPRLALANEGEFSFGDPDQPVSADTELLSIFHQEARELMVALQGHFATLTQRPSDVGVLGSVERIFHTLKGAAATVGLRQVSEHAAKLRSRVEQAIEANAPITSESRAELVEGTNDLLVLAGLPRIDSVSGVGSPGAGSFIQQPAEGFFQEEAHQICTRALTLSRELDGATLERAKEISAELGRLFHRLKGSALTTTHQSVCEEAQRLQQTCEGGVEVRANEIVEGVMRIARVLGLDLSEPAPPVSRSVIPPRGPVREAVRVAAEPALWDAFVRECAELLESIERTTLDLENSDQPRRSLESLLRDYHTLKGAVNTIGLTPTGKELHVVESFLEALLARSIMPSMRIVTSALLQVQSSVRRQLRQCTHGYVETAIADLETSLANVLRGHLSATVGRTASASGAETGDSVSVLERSASQGSAGSGRDTPDALERRYIRVGIERLDGLMNLAGELVVSRSRLMTRVGILRTLQQELGRASGRLVSSVERFRDEHEFSKVEGGAAIKADTAGPSGPDRMVVTSNWAGFSELELDRYDDVNLLSRSLAEITNDVSEMNGLLSSQLAGFADDSDAFGSLVSGIQNEVTRARMVPLDAVFTRLRLPIRDAAERENKDVRVVTRGEEVSLDKTIADALFAPMLHLVRNAVVHGLESVSAREARGKSATGVITLGAREASGQIVLEVHDDGAGLDLSALLARGIAMGLLPSGTSVNDPQVKELVFAAGLSTKAAAGAVSGRGVGGDIVRRSIERLNGSIRVDSVPGQGTTFTMALPVTLAITKALLVRHKSRTFAIPLYFSERIIDAADATVHESAGTRRLKVADEFIALERLGELFGAQEEGADRGPLLVLRVGDQRVTLQVDSVVAQEEIVVKDLGALLTGHPLFAGVTIRGNGDLVLILDVPRLLERRAERRRSATDQAETTATAPDAATVSALVEGTPRLPEAEPPALPPARAGQAKRTRVLFVDDSLSVRKVAEKTLLALGVEVELAVDGFDALSKLREGAFDIVFTDLEMPRMHGYDLIRELRFLPTFKDLPIVVISSRSGQKHQDQARALGATDYLTKPFSQQTIEQALERYCSRFVVGTPGRGRPPR